MIHPNHIKCQNISQKKEFMKVKWINKVIALGSVNALMKMALRMLAIGAME